MQDVAEDLTRPTPFATRHSGSGRLTVLESRGRTLGGCRCSG